MFECARLRCCDAPRILSAERQASLPEHASRGLRYMCSNALRDESAIKKVEDAQDATRTQ